MFTADIAWTDHKNETVGQRKERKAREGQASRAGSVASNGSSNKRSYAPSAAPSIRSAKTVGSGRHESFLSSFRKRPKEERSIRNLKQFISAPTHHSVQQASQVELPGDVPAKPFASEQATFANTSQRREPVRNNSYCSGALMPEPSPISPALTNSSIASLNSLASDPQPKSRDGSMSDSTNSNSTVIEKIYEIQKLGELSSVERVTTTTVEIQPAPPPPPRSKKRETAVRMRTPVSGSRVLSPPPTISELAVSEAETPVRGRPSFSQEISDQLEQLRFHQRGASQDVRPDPYKREPMHSLRDSGSTFSSSDSPMSNHSSGRWSRPPPAYPVLEHPPWKAPAEWDVYAPKPLHNIEEKPPATAASVVHGNEKFLSSEMTHFQRYIRRMATAKPKVIRDRLLEEWSITSDPTLDQELFLEKRLWVLTALHLQKIAHPEQPPPPLSIPGKILEQKKILELYGHISEVYQLSSTNPHDQIHFLTTLEQPYSDLPYNVQYIGVPQPGITPVPYGSASFDHVRASSLPALVPSNKIPAILRECYRVLKKRGIVEFRVIDATPVGKSMGPQLRGWFEDHLDPNIEKNFHCAKPSRALPHWVQTAGFRLLREDDKQLSQTIRVPVIFDKALGGDDLELAVLVGRALWMEVWGPLIVQVPGMPKWWWEYPELVEECRVFQTYMEIGTLAGYKE